jgi:hypothetical protein
MGWKFILGNVAAAKGKSLNSPLLGNTIMGGRKAQVALFVLAGLILLFIVVLAIYLVSQKRAETATTTNEQLELQNNPDLAAEKARAQARLDTCLAETTQGAIEDYQTEIQQAAMQQVGELSDYQTQLTQAIADEFPSCFYRFNTKDSLLITDSQPPRVSLIFSTNAVKVAASYNAAGTYNGFTYHLNTYLGNVQTDFGRAARDSDATFKIVENALSGHPDATNPFVNKESNTFNPYALADQQKYLNLIIQPDGSCTAIIYDYTAVQNGADTQPTILAKDYTAADAPACKGLL